MTKPKETSQEQMAKPTDFPNLTAPLNMTGQNQGGMCQQGCCQTFPNRSHPKLAQLGYEQPYPAQQMAEPADFSNLTAPLNVEDEAIRKWNKALNKEALTKELHEKAMKIETLNEESEESNEILEFQHDDLNDLDGEIDTLEKQIDHMHEILGTYPNKTLRSIFDKLIGLTEEEKAAMNEWNERERVHQWEKNQYEIKKALARVEMLSESCKMVNKTLINRMKH